MTLAELKIKDLEQNWFGNSKTFNSLFLLFPSTPEEVIGPADVMKKCYETLGVYLKKAEDDVMDLKIAACDLSTESQVITDKIAKIYNKPKSLIGKNFTGFIIYLEKH